MNSFKHFWVVVVMLAFGLCLYAQSFAPDSPLPLNEEVIFGQLENGLTYYILPNREPKDSAMLFLAVKAGSVLENDDQQGLAHFAEHMAFNSTANFPGTTLQEYLESTGMGMLTGRSGAGTSFDFTMYWLTSSTTNKEQLNQMFQVLSDWSARVLFEDEFIEKERGIIVEEWRFRSGGMERIQMQLITALLGEDSQYAKRYPIGKLEVIENFKPQTIKDFYHDWYRPDLQAVIAVGDFEVDEIKQLLQSHFGDIPARVNPRPVPDFPITPHAETRFAFIGDNEATFSNIQILSKFDYQPVNTVTDFRNETVIRLLITMLNNRFEEMTMRENPPFVGAFSSKGRLFGDISTSIVSAHVDEANVLNAFEAIITEVERARQHGFFESELVRAKDILLNQARRAFHERDKTNSHRHAYSLMFHFFNDNLAMGAEYEFNLMTYLLDTISLWDIDIAIDNFLIDENRVISVIYPAPSVDLLPSQEQILVLFDEIVDSELDLYPETILVESLLSDMPRRIRVSKPKYDRRLDMYTWNLKNGAKVHLKTTDFRNNEILFSAFRDGGLSHANDDIFLSANNAIEILSESGLGAIDQMTLNSFLAGKDVSLDVVLSLSQERFSGRSSTEEFETMLQLLRLHFTEPRFDEQAFTNWLTKTEISLRNLLNSPDVVFGSEATNMLYDNHPRAVMMSVEDLQNICHTEAFKFFQSRFSSANDFHFVFVGNIDHTTLHTYIETYIATLPNQRTRTNVIDRKFVLSQKKETRELYIGQDERTMMIMAFAENTRFTPRENLVLSLNNHLLNSLLHENVREKISGAYVVQGNMVIPSPRFSPQVMTMVIIGCSPDRVDEMVEAIEEQIQSIQNDTFEERHLENARESLRQSYHQNKDTNRYWLSQISQLLQNTTTTSDILNYLNRVDSITRADVVRSTRNYVNFDNQRRLIMFPASHADSENEYAE
jgi:zinc protease